MSTGAAALFASTGGVMEAALRTASFYVTGKELTGLSKKIFSCVVFVCCSEKIQRHSGSSSSRFSSWSPCDS